VHLLAAAAVALLLPGFSPVATGPNGGQVLSGQIPGTPRAADVYLPPGFDAARRYPVVYLLHGMPGTPSEYVDGAGLLSFADSSVSAGKVEPFIAVMPAAGDDPGYDGEWAGPWENELVDDVVPWIDSHLPTIRSADGRVIAGLSAGGFGAVNILLRHPGLFGTAESWSGYFTPLHDGPFKNATLETLSLNDPVALARSEAARLRAAHARFFLSTGPFHSHWINPADTRSFASELSSLGVTSDYRYFPTLAGEWSSQLAAGLTWALPSS
jgi:enterochelin esterase-like enzyme